MAISEKSHPYAPYPALREPRLLFLGGAKVLNRRGAFDELAVLSNFLRAEFTAAEVGNAAAISGCNKIKLVPRT